MPRFAPSANNDCRRLATSHFALISVAKTRFTTYGKLPQAALKLRSLNGGSHAEIGPGSAERPERDGMCFGTIPATSSTGSVVFSLSIRAHPTPLPLALIFWTFLRCD